MAALNARIRELEPLAAKVKDWEARYNGMLKEKDSALAKLTANLAALEPLQGKVDASAAKVRELEEAAALAVAARAGAEKLQAAKAGELDLAWKAAQTAALDIDKLKGRLQDVQAAATTAIAAHEAAEKAHATQINELEAALAVADESGTAAVHLTTAFRNWKWRIPERRLKPMPHGRLLRRRRSTSTS